MTSTRKPKIHFLDPDRDRHSMCGFNVDLYDHVITDHEDRVDCKGCRKEMDRREKINNQLPVQVPDAKNLL